MTKPPISALIEIANVLKNADVTFALGGSGLLAFHGLSENVRDWDITTDAPLEKIRPLMEPYEHELIGPNGIFATAFMFKIHLHGASIDLMGTFAIKTEDGEHKVPTIVKGSWNGVPLGSPEAWEKAYRLMGRIGKANLLSNFLSATSEKYL